MRLAITISAGANRVELRFFAGLNIPETADALGVSTATVEREWAMAKAWLHQRLSTPQEPPAG